MHVLLTPELEGIVQAKVKSGYYNNASEVIRDAIRRLHEQDSINERLKLAIQLGREDVINGRVKPLDMDSIEKLAKLKTQNQEQPKADVTP
jgi:antitoxin ParD1/3/4